MSRNEIKMPFYTGCQGVYELDAILSYSVGKQCSFQYENTLKKLVINKCISLLSSNYHIKPLQKVWKAS